MAQLGISYLKLYTEREEEQKNTALRRPAGSVHGNYLQARC